MKAPATCFGRTGYPLPHGSPALVPWLVIVGSTLTSGPTRFDRLRTCQSGVAASRIRSTTSGIVSSEVSITKAPSAGRRGDASRVESA